jgi:hypothetical protein
MPYAVLVTALGAITSTAVAMFVLHSWSATKIAPLIGAILGLAIGIGTLRLRGLPLTATLEEYRAGRGGESIKEAFSQGVRGALAAAVVISIVEMPAVLIDNSTLPFVLLAGWIVLVAHTFHRAWKLNAQRLLSSNLDVFNLAGGLALIGICSTLVYFVFAGLQRGAANTEVSALFLVKAIVVWNLFTAIDAAAIAIFGICALEQVLKLTSPERYR